MQKLAESMPQALLLQFNEMSNDNKLTLMLSGYGHKYIPEWKDIYQSTAELIYSLYKLRSDFYDGIPFDNG